MLAISASVQCTLSLGNASFSVKMQMTPGQHESGIWDLETMLLLFYFMDESIISWRHHMGLIARKHAFEARGLDISDIENRGMQQTANAQSVPLFHDPPGPYEPRCEKTGSRGFRPGPTQTRLYGNRRWLET